MLLLRANKLALRANEVASGRKEIERESETDRRLQREQREQADRSGATGACFSAQARTPVGQPAAPNDLWALLRRVRRQRTIRQPPQHNARGGGGGGGATSARFSPLLFLVSSWLSSCSTVCGALIRSSSGPSERCESLPGRASPLEWRPQFDSAPNASDCERTTASREQEWRQWQQKQQWAFVLGASERARARHRSAAAQPSELQFIEEANWSAR